ncbi:MAG: prepilin-type N-terminal cleavage/methylation domain-containing protein [Actinobacteria bacterium]|nr:prepilin-type N-terminal cleavage/methylation domain-containing protein [Actinomycetota bacterium]
MNKRILNKNGFTLLEIIISLILLAVVVAVVGMSGSYLVKSFLFSEKNVDTLLKGQVAMARMLKELNNIKYINTNPAYLDATKIKFISYKDAVETYHTISWGGSGTNLLFDGDVLTDQVSSFSLSYYANPTGSGAVLPTGTGSLITGWLIEINLVLTGADNVPAVFNDRVAPSFTATTGW